MSIKSDRWIRRMAAKGMIEPFADAQVREVDGRKIVSYGTSSYGYDVRCAGEFKIFTNINSTIVDPKHFDPNNFVDVNADVCIVPPNSFALARTVEYFRIPRSTMVICLGKSTYARCFSGDTRVALVDGSAPTLEEMARRADSGEMFWGYSVGEYGRVIVTLLEAPRFVGRDSLLEIALDDGQLICATPDHEFLTRDGRLIAAGQLCAGDSLMPLYRSIQRGYEMVYQPINGHLFPTHRLADEWNLRHAIYEEIPDTHRHHVDLNRRNNCPVNIVRMKAGDHIRLHNDISYGDGFDREEHGASIRAAFERLRQDASWVGRHSATQSDKATRFWSDERYAEVRRRVLEARGNVSASTRQLHRDAMLRRFSDPDARSLHSHRMAEAWERDDGSRRLRQQEVARRLNLRQDITEEVVRRALRETGSIRGAARLLGCDRTVFRRFPDLIRQARGQGIVRNHKVAGIRNLPGDHDVYCLTVPEAGNFALEAGVFVRNCGIIVNVTPLEPEWEGHVTLEFSNTTPLPARIYANEGVAQLLFFESDEPCETSYRDRGGKYQGQLGVTLPKA